MLGRNFSVNRPQWISDHRRASFLCSFGEVCAEPLQPGGLRIEPTVEFEKKKRKSPWRKPSATPEGRERQIDGKIFRSYESWTAGRKTEFAETRWREKSNQPASADRHKETTAPEVSRPASSAVHLGNIPTNDPIGCAHPIASSVENELNPGKLHSRRPRALFNSTRQAYLSRTYTFHDQGCRLAKEPSVELCSMRPRQ